MSIELNRPYIIKLKEERNWSMAKLAQQAGVSKAMIVLWVNGDRSGTGSKLIKGMIEAFPEESPINLILGLDEFLGKRRKNGKMQ